MGGPELTFTLFASEAPYPPSTNRWADKLRWMLFVMNPDDEELSFIASVFSYCLAKGGLTEKQEWRVNKILRRVQHAWDNEALLCRQMTECYARRQA